MTAAPGDGRGSGGPLQRLRELYGNGLLAARYNEVRGLLATMDGGPDVPWADLARAGQLLSRLDPAEIERENPTVDRMTVAITGHSLLHDLVAPLTAEFARHGVVLRPVPGDFDGYLRDLYSPDSCLYSAGVELALCVLDSYVLFDELPTPWRLADVEKAIADKLTALTGLAESYLARCSGTLVLNTVPLLRRHTHQLVDHRSRAQLGAVWREFNAGLLRLAGTHSRVVVVDLDPLMAAGGPVNDPRLSGYVRAHLGDELLGRYAREIGHVARALRGYTSKVLVLDLDNTLWDGVLADDGYDGVAAAGTVRAEAFGAFQRVVKQIASQGVLLAVSSKNDEDDARRVLRSHPDMLLRLDDFSALSVDWSPKDSQLRGLSQRLNLNLDSFVFVDDSAFECGLVAATLPQVSLVRLDDEPAMHIERLLADGWFDTRELSDDDRARAAQYRAEAARQRLLADTPSLAEYLRSLDLVVTVAPVQPEEVGRIAQLTIRTNQFNLTARRFGPDEVRSRSVDPECLVATVRARDRFSDNGIVGALFARREPDGTYLDNVLLSCRAFGRGIEQAAMTAVLAHTRDSGNGPVLASYRATEKNSRVRDFYTSVGFAETGRVEDETWYRHDLVEVPAVPGHIRLRARLGTDAEGGGDDGS